MTATTVVGTDGTTTTTSSTTTTTDATSSTTSTDAAATDGIFDLWLFRVFKKKLISFRFLSAAKEDDDDEENDVYNFKGERYMPARTLAGLMPSALLEVNIILKYFSKFKYRVISNTTFGNELAVIWLANRNPMQGQ